MNKPKPAPPRSDGMTSKDLIYMIHFQICDAFLDYQNGKIKPDAALKRFAAALERINEK